MPANDQLRAILDNACAAGMRAQENDFLRERQLLALEPGDATRYEIAICTVGGARGLRTLFAWTNAQGGGRAMLLGAKLPCPEYIAEKMNVRPYESAIFAAFLRGYFTARPESE